MAVIRRLPSSPKQHGRRSKEEAGAWYRFYAGFSEDFVRDVITDLKPHSRDIVADPWNGAGTTTSVAAQLGISSWGGDINPAMVVVAKARLLGGRVRPSELSLADGILDLAMYDASPSTSEADPLRAWFRLEACSSIRAIERAIALLLVPGDGRDPNAAVSVAALSPLAAFFYLALFRSVQELLARFRCSNPTWIRRPRGERSRLAPSRETVSRCFRSQVGAMTGAASSRRGREGVLSSTPNQFGAPALRSNELARINPLENDYGVTLAVADSTSLPIPSRSVAAVVSSPPYCTRIDYAVATSPELAILGFDDERVRSLRQAMIGSSTVSVNSPRWCTRWGPTCTNFLRGVEAHPSKASATYYLRNHLQYFDRLYRSLREIDRVLIPRSPCVLVVQDSRYKELHNDLPAIVVEMTESLGWRLVQRHDYRATRNIGRVHPRVKAYAKFPVPIEAALLLQTPGKASEAGC